MDQPKRSQVLSTDHMNYLVWRYLQESNYWRATLRLQQEWGRDDPELLKFSPNIDTYALINLVQKGLQYVALEEELKIGSKPTKTPLQLFFGTDGVWDAAPNVPAEAPRRAASPRKHHRESTAGSALDSTSQAPAAKRPRRATVLDGASAAPAKSGDEMELDEQAVSEDAEHSNDNSRMEHSNLPNGRLDHQDSAPGYSPSEPSNAAAAAATPSPEPKPSTLEIGGSKPTQTNTITDLESKDTQMLETAAQEGLLTAWNPQQANVLVSGGDGVCTLFRWPVHFGDAPATNGSTPTAAPPHTSDLYDNMQGAVVTALAWSPDGQQLAVARHSEASTDTSSTITLFDAKGQMITSFVTDQTLALGLAYSASSKYLLAYGGLSSHYADDSRDYAIYVWDTGSSDAPEPLDMLLAKRQVIQGATWADEDCIIACGPGFLSQTKLSDDQLQDWQPILPEVAHGPEDAPYEWSTVTWDKFSNACALAEGSQGLVAMLSPDRQSLKTHAAHDMEITSLQFQPLPQHGSTGEGPRLLASASLDGTLKIWNVAEDMTRTKTLHCDSVQPEKFPILAAQFSPDGASIAAASHDRVFFWRPDPASDTWPIVSWVLKAESGWKASATAEAKTMTNGDAGPISNGLSNGVNGLTNGHVADGESANEAVQADRMDVDGTEGKETQGTQVEPWDLAEGNLSATLLWSALGKKIAFGNRSQIAVADFAKAAIQ